LITEDELENLKPRSDSSPAPGVSRGGEHQVVSCLAQNLFNERAAIKADSSVSMAAFLLNSFAPPICGIGFDPGSLAQAVRE
jgi:hypothetical protein